MNAEEYFTYQVIASRAGDPSAGELRAKVGTGYLLIGSGEQVDLHLEGAPIQPVHARLFITSTGQVMLSNLGEAGTMAINGEPMAAYAPVHWKPGIGVQLGDYTLQLVTLVVEDAQGKRQQVRPAVITQESSPAGEPPPQLVIDWGAKDVQDMPVKDDTLPLKSDETELGEPLVVHDPAVPAPDQPEAVLPYDLPGIQGDASHDDETRRHASETIIEPPPATAGAPAPKYAPPENSELANTPAMPFDYDALELLAAAQRINTGAVVQPSRVVQTLPKDWHYSGKLSAQLTINPVNLVPGERVRIPISIRNEYNYPIQLRVFVAGLPREWIILPTPLLDLAPAEIRAIDLVLQTQANVEEIGAETIIWLSDRVSPDVVLTLPLQLVYKKTPNITGKLQPTNPRDNSQIYLYLQNHTQASTTVFISGHSETPEFHVVPAHTQVELPPGQEVEIPIHIDVARRRLFLRHRRLFSVSARHSNRAPLDYPGRMTINPRLSPILMALPLIALIAAVIVLPGILKAPTSATPSKIAPPATVSTVTSAPRLLAPAEKTENAQPSAPESTTAVRAAASEVPTTAPATPLHTPTAPPTLTSTPSAAPSPTTLPATETPVFSDPRPTGCSVPIPAGWEPYTVRSGDGLFRLAINSGTTVEEVAKINCVKDTRLLQIGQILLLPQP